METPIYEKDYGIDLIPKIKNPNLKKFYEILGVERSTYFIGKYLNDVLGDCGIFYNTYHDYEEYNLREEQLLKDFDQFKKMNWDKLTILHIKKFIKFIGG